VIGNIEENQPEIHYKNVLLVEPIHNYRHYIETALQGSEFAVVSVATPEEALAIMKRMKPHVVLIEDNLPGCDIKRFLLQLRETGLECPLIVMSTKGSLDHIRKYAYLSVSDFLIKPIDETRLLRSLRNACDAVSSIDQHLSLNGRCLARVLIVDDIGASRRMLGSYLEQNGYASIEAGSGMEAVTHAMSGGVDLLLLDYKMRDMNGLDVLQELRMRGKSIPTIMVSAHATPEIVSKARLFGAVDFFRKPIDFPVLVARIGEMVGLDKEGGRGTN